MQRSYFFVLLGSQRRNNACSQAGAEKEKRAASSSSQPWELPKTKSVLCEGDLGTLTKPCWLRSAAASLCGVGLHRRCSHRLLRPPCREPLRSPSGRHDGFVRVLKCSVLAPATSRPGDAWGGCRGRRACSPTSGGRRGTRSGPLVRRSPRTRPAFLAKGPR